MLKADDESVTSDVWISDSKVKWLNGNWASAAADAEAPHKMELTGHERHGRAAS